MLTPADAGARTLAVLVACHNRRATTLACLDALWAQAQPGLQMRLYLFDDGSTDGTAEAVRARHPGATVLHGDGQQFWNRSMHQAFAQALRDGHDAYLWLNDDTALFPQALALLQSAAGQARETYGQDAIVVGATCEPQGGALSYGAGRRSSPRWRPFRHEMVPPNGEIQPVHLMNGNCVWIPAAAAARVGNLDPVYEHAMGDTDYALRALQAGVPLVLAADYIGCCARNPVQGSIRDPSLSLRQRWRVAVSRKGLPPRSWWHFCRRHGGPLWPLHFAWGYLHILIGRRR